MHSAEDKAKGLIPNTDKYGADLHNTEDKLKGSLPNTGKFGDFFHSAEDKAKGLIPTTDSTKVSAMINNAETNGQSLLQNSTGKATNFLSEAENKTSSLLPKESDINLDQFKYSNESNPNSDGFKNIYGNFKDSTSPHGFSIIPSPNKISDELKGSIHNQRQELERNIQAPKG